MNHLDNLKDTFSQKLDQRIEQHEAFFEEELENLSAILNIRNKRLRVIQPAGNSQHPSKS